MADPPVELDPTVALQLVALRHVGVLATRPEGAGAHVPAEDMAAALSFAERIEEFVGHLRAKMVMSVPNWGGLGGTLGEVAVGTAASGARAVRQLVERQVRPGTTPAAAVDRHAFLYYANQVHAAREFLEVIAGERPWADSAGARLNIAAIEGWHDEAEIVISFVPVVGTLYGLGMAIYGKTMLGRKRSALERVVLVAGPILEVASAIVKGTSKITGQAIMVAKISNYGQVQIKGFATIFDALEMAVGARALTETDTATLARIAKAVKAGAVLTETEIVEANYIVSRMRESATAAEWLEITRAATGKPEQPGKYITQLRQTELMVGEAEAAEKTATALGEQVVALPKATPVDYRTGRVNSAGKFKQIDGVKHPDLLIGGELADIVVPLTKDIKALIGTIGIKHRQGGTVVVNLGARCPVRAPDLIAQFGRFWGKPEFMSIWRVVVVDGATVQPLIRPAKYRPPVVPAKSNGIAAAVLLRRLDDVRAEDASR